MEQRSWPEKSGALEYLLSFGGFKDKQPFTEWPSLGILEGSFRLPVSMSFTVSLPLLPFEYLKREREPLNSRLLLMTCKGKGGGHLIAV